MLVKFRKQKTSSTFIFNICKQSFEQLISTVAYVFITLRTRAAQSANNWITAHKVHGFVVPGLLLCKINVLRCVRDTESNGRTVVIEVRHPVKPEKSFRDLVRGELVVTRRRPATQATPEVLIEEGQPQIDFSDIEKCESEVTVIDAFVNWLFVE